MIFYFYFFLRWGWGVFKRGVVGPTSMWRMSHRRGWIMNRTGWDWEVEGPKAMLTLNCHSLFRIAFHFLDFIAFVHTHLFSLYTSFHTPVNPHVYLCLSLTFPHFFFLDSFPAVINFLSQMIQSHLHTISPTMKINYNWQGLILSDVKINN